MTLDGKLVALKQIKLDKPNLPCNRKLIIQEAKEIVQLDHVNIIKCFGVCPPIGLIVLELAEKEVVFKRKAISLNSLRQLIDTVKRSFPLSLKLDALSQIASGLEYLKLKKVYYLFNEKSFSQTFAKPQSFVMLPMIIYFRLSMVISKVAMSYSVDQTVPKLFSSWVI